MIEQLMGILMGLDAWVLYGAAGLFALLETSILVGVLVPGDTILLLAASTVTTPARFAMLLGLTVAGSLAGEAIGYLIGRTWGGRLRVSRLGRRLGEDRWAQAERYLAERGGKAVFAARFVAFVHALVPVVAGTVRMPFARFISFSAAGAVLWSALYVSTGALAGASWRSVSDQFGLASYVLAGLVAVGIVGAWALRRARARRQASRPAAPRSHPTPADAPSSACASLVTTAARRSAD